MQAQQLVAICKGKINLQTVELAEPQAHEVCVEMAYSTVSPGTELAFLHAKPNATRGFPMHLGYSACGKIIQLGTACGDLQTGQWVVCATHHASHNIVSAQACHRLPNGLEPLSASAFMLGSIAVQGVRKALVELGDRVAVIGLGPIGLLAAQLAVTSGAGHVCGFDLLAWRRGLAKRWVDETFSPDQIGDCADSFDVVIDATGFPQAIIPAFRLTRRAGRVVLLGSTRGTTDDVNFYRDVHKKGLTVVGAHASIRPADDEFATIRSLSTDNKTILTLAAKGRIDLSSVISKKVTIGEAQSAYDCLARQDEEIMSVAFDWQKR